MTETGATDPAARGQAGFTLVEFTIASVVLLVLAGAVFAMLAATQEGAARQGEVQSVADNTRNGLDTVCRYFRQAGNDPLGSGFEGIQIISPTEVRLRSDITGSAGHADPDKGDPDGDTSDAGEDVIIRYRPAARTIELQPAGGAAQTLVSEISAFSLQYFDDTGRATDAGANARRVRIDLTGTSPARALRTGAVFSLALGTDVQVASRQ